MARVVSYEDSSVIDRATVKKWPMMTIGIFGARPRSLAR